MPVVVIAARQSPSAGTLSTTNMPADDSPNGAIKKSTSIGIGVGLLLFVILVTSFFLVARYRKPPRQLTADEVRAHETLDRVWRLKHKTGRASTAGSTTELAQMPRRSATFDTDRTFVEETASQDTLALPAPPPAAHQPAQRTRRLWPW